jgi:hypothetical protein
MGGRCYVSSPEGSVYQVELRAVPRLVLVVDQRRLAEHENILRLHQLTKLLDIKTY